MKSVLVVGHGSKAGAWKIRGEQLGAAIGARVMNGLNNTNLVGTDLVVLVKRPRGADLQRLHATGLPLVWDIVDGWPQPIGNWWAKEACMQWLKLELKRIKPAAIVVASKVMAEDCARWNLPTLVLYHHARPGLVRNPIHRKVERVGYEGGVQHLQKWNDVMEKLCKKRGWTFVLNPSSLSQIDIVVAVREPRGYAASNWKSNVKLANAQGSGTPCVLHPEAAYLETESGVELWCNTEEEMDSALTTLAEWSYRVQVSETLHSKAPKLSDIAFKYRGWLESLK